MAGQFGRTIKQEAASLWPHRTIGQKSEATTELVRIAGMTLLKAGSWHSANGGFNPPRIGVDRKLGGLTSPARQGGELATAFFRKAGYHAAALGEAVSRPRRFHQ